MRAAKQAVFGQVIRPCKVTGTGVILALLYIGGPIVLGLALVDVLIWAIAKFGFGVCYGIWCWF